MGDQPSSRYCIVNKGLIWRPLISAPEVMMNYTRALGVSNYLEFQDIFSTEDWILEMIESKVISVLLVFPLTEGFREFRLVNQKCSDPMTCEIYKLVDNNELWFMKQVVGNACGQIALFHSILNNRENLHLKEGSLAHKLAAVNGPSAADIRGNMLKTDPEFSTTHDMVISCCDQDLNDNEEYKEVDTHYVVFVDVNGDLYEFDGQLPHPIKHGKINGNLLKSAVKVIKHNFLDHFLGGKESRFAILAMCLGQSEEINVEKLDKVEQAEEVEVS
ncbi:ubiquitin carboxyl-terminal family 1 protein [Cryptosporidium andersoni]|uniref:Ubiquitin carboxyl-terminal hydrolase n=1 Tax=Cryptosporidium andersoni TaxID=117008 RepID=A0A1J4MW10_9CRYT|nr:ubiquitin carboxyl-terminal family 1 protein [Cryptosporidium andersoni]